ncbi:MAG TPA: transcriptional repressor [Solirubrobacteraceae bacterium]|nr:transcriptional repressor [Solirubrobacteraceae bacterium]
MAQSEETIRRTLRGHGLRSTPQRHAILKAFESDAGEHLSAEEIHSRASRSLGSLSRGTVYAALTELTELGLLSAVGLPDPVRYELNTLPHDHFRCRLCTRLFDLDSDPAIRPTGPPRALVERVDVRSEGVCADCLDYEAGLENGVGAIFGRAGTRPWSQALQAPEIACAAMDSPLGPLLLAASPAGVLRLAFEDHFDAAKLREKAASRRGARAARRHLTNGAQALEAFLAGERRLVDCAVDPVLLLDAEPALSATRAIPYAGHASYVQLLDSGLAPRELGRWMGANPMPIIFPCHRLTRGKEIPESFVGGNERRRWLEAHERAHASLDR